jgi:hypothetical protein
MAGVTVISGTDPTNPRSAQHIVDRLEQIARDTAAMAEEARRLSVFAGGIRCVLLRAGIDDDEAVVETQSITRRCTEMAAKLDDVSSWSRVTSSLITALYDTLRINARLSFRGALEWVEENYGPRSRRGR